MIGGAGGASILCALPSHAMVLLWLICWPSGSMPLTVRFISFPTASKVTVISFSSVPGANLDLPGLRFQVPMNGLSAATRAVENKHATATTVCNPRITNPLPKGCRIVYRRRELNDAACAQVQNPVTTHRDACVDLSSGSSGESSSPTFEGHRVSESQVVGSSTLRRHS